MPNGVGLGVLVTTWAVRRQHPFDAAPSIFFVRNYVEMIWPDASAIPAQVVNDQSVRDGLLQLIGETVDKHDAIRVLHLAVTVWHNVSSPEPT